MGERSREITPSATAARPLPAPELPAAMAEGPRRTFLRGPLVYYLLAAFDVLTVSASLYLNHRIMGIYVQSVRANQDWAQRIAEYSALGELAARVNAPGNDVFDTGDVGLEAVRMQRARLEFHARLGALRDALPARVEPADSEALRGRMATVERALDEMVEEAGHIFSNLAAGRSQPAGERMATMDRRYARVLAALRELHTEATAIQQRHFGRQTAAAATLQRFEYLIAGLILVMVGAATAYGRRINRQATRDALERATYVEGLQAAEESLRKAHTHLEKRVEDRTRALRESEAALRRSAEEWQRTFEAIDSPVMILGPDGRVRRLNRAAAERAGHPPAAVEGLAVVQLGPGEPWSSAARVAERAQAARAAASVQARDAASGRTWEVAGNLVADDAGGGGERVIVVARDVTPLVELQESVRREERMSAMGSLVAGVAHEVRNPLFGISSTLDAFEARYGETEPFQKYVSVLRREADRMGTLMRDLLEYGRPPGLDASEVDLAQLVDEAVQLCLPHADSGGVRLERTGQAGRVRLDRGRMLQVLQNLIQNAIQHSPAGGVVAVAVGETSDDGGPREVWCAVRDEGPGFRGEDLPRLFEPFFTRRPGGTGMGLSIAQRIVSQHGGQMEAANRPQGGAELRVRLPAVPPS